MKTIISTSLVARFQRSHSWGLVCLIATMPLCLSARAEATYGQQVVAAVLLAEARSEGEQGMTAVAEVIRNRANHYGVSPLAVVKMRRQFSCLNNTTPEQLIRQRWLDRDWPKALEIARITYNEPARLPGIARGATHFESSYAWWVEGRDPLVVIGKLKFYRLALPPPQFAAPDSTAHQASRQRRVGAAR